MKIFVTGGGGFIGSNFISSVRNDFDIVCFGHDNYFSEVNKVFGNKVELVDGDVADRKQVSAAIEGCDVVVHFAGPAGNAACMKDPNKAVSTHVVGTRTVLKEAVKNNVDNFVFASTQSVYTTYERRQLPFTEESSLEPDDFYGMLKAMAEDEIRSSDVNHVILRLANVYGYGNGLFVDKMGGAIGNFIKASLAGTDITIAGTGKQIMDEYVNVKDVCGAFKMVIEESVSNEIFNVGTGRPMAVEYLAQKISELAKSHLGNEVLIKKLPASPGATFADRYVSVDKIKRKIKWEPKISLEDGVIEFFNR